MIKIKKKQGWNIKAIIGALLILLAMVIFIVLLIPLILGLFYMFLAIVKIYALVDINFKLIGGFIFLFIYYEIYKALLYVIITIWNTGEEFLK